MTVRSFIALPIPKEAANQLGDLAAKMAYQDKSNAVKWVDQENYHITLAFLGEQREADLENLVEALDHHIQQHEFIAQLSHLSPFPESKPKLLAAMLTRSEQLLDLHQGVLSAVRSVNMLADKRKFKPHVTLGRFRHSKNQFAGQIPPMNKVEFYVDELVLFESILSSNGATYEPLMRFPLDFSSLDLATYVEAAAE